MVVTTPIRPTGSTSASRSVIALAGMTGGSGGAMVTEIAPSLKSGQLPSSAAPFATAAGRIAGSAQCVHTASRYGPIALGWAIGGLASSMVTSTTPAPSGAARVAV